MVLIFELLVSYSKWLLNYLICHNEMKENLSVFFYFLFKSHIWNKKEKMARNIYKSPFVQSYFIKRNNNYKIIKSHSLESFQSGTILMICYDSSNDVKIHRHGQMTSRKGTRVLTALISGLWDYR